MEGADTFFPFSDACNKVAFYGVNGIWQESTYMALQLVDNNLAEQTNYITITIKKNGSYRLITGSYFYMRLYINSVFHSVATCNNTLLNLKQGDKITVFNANDYTSHGAVVLFYVGE